MTTTTELTLRKGTTAEHATFTGAEAEITFNTTTKGLVVHDGTTVGGRPLATDSSAALRDRATHTGVQAISTISGLQTALNNDAADLVAHEGDTANPHAVTKAQVGLANVDNTSDMDKPISNAVQTRLDTTVNFYESRVDLGAYTFTADDAGGVPRVIGKMTTAGELVWDSATLTEAKIGDETITTYFTRMAGEIIVVDANDKVLRIIDRNYPFTNQVACEDYATRSTSSSVAVVGRENKILGYLLSEETFNDAQPDNILYFSPNMDLTGVIDESTTLKQAHDAAVAAGLKTLYVEGVVNCPSVTKIGDLHFRTRTGKGAFKGAPFRRRVVPLEAESHDYFSGIIPRTHLKRLATKLATATLSDPAIIVYMSDSWGQPNQLIGLLSQFEMLLRRELVRQFGADAVKIRVVNRAVGGTTWQDANGTLVQGVTSWATGVDQPWLSYVTSVEQSDLTPTSRVPDVCMVMFGMNQATPPVAADITAMNAVIAALRAVTTDVIVMTSTVPSLQEDPWGTKVAQEARQAWAGYQRSVAHNRGYGLIDFARAGDAHRDGFDPTESHWSRLLLDAAVNLPYTGPVCEDFSFKFTVAGGAGSFWSTGDGLLTVPLSAIAGNVLILERDGGGNVAYTIMSATGITSVARTVSSVPAVAGVSDPIVEVSAMGVHLIVRVNNVYVFNGPVERAWSPYSPVITFGGSPTLAVTMNYTAVSVPAFRVPTITDAEMWGVDGGPEGGNNVNHLGEKARHLIFAQVLRHTNFN